MVHSLGDRFLDEPKNRSNQSAPIVIPCPSKLKDTSSSVTHCISPTSCLSSQFLQSVAFSPTSSADDLQNRSTRHPFLPNANTSTTTTTTVPLMSNVTSSNLLLSFPEKRYDLYHPQVRRDQQNIAGSPATSSSSNAATSTHVLCR